MTDAEAVAILARHLAANTLTTLVDDDNWEDYPEVGESDWERIADAALRLVTMPGAEEVEVALAVLAARVSEDEPK